MAGSQKKGKAKHLKLVFQILFFAALTVLAFYYILKEDPKKVFQTLSQARALPLSLAVVIVLVTIVLDGLSLTILTRLFNHKYHYYQGLINTMIGGLVGVYVKSAAPLIQAYTFRKQDVRNSEAASVLTMNFLLYQLSLCIYSLIIIIAGYPIMKNVPLPILWDMKLIYLVSFGMAVQFLFLIGAILLAYCRPLHRLFLNTGINVLSKLHILRNPEQTRKRLTVQFATYRIEMKRMKANIPQAAMVMGINFLRLFLLGMLPFIIFLSLVPSGTYNLRFFAQSITGTGFVNVISSFVTVGAPEVIFQDAFSFFLKDVSSISSSESIASAANILWRFLTFYLILILGLFTTLLYRGSPKRSEILSSTGTIYDLEMSEIQDADDETKEYLREIRQKGDIKREPLLSKEDIESSFASLRDNLNIEENQAKEIVDDKEFEKILEERKSALAEVVKEYDVLVKSTPSKEEINKESEKEFSLFAEKRRKQAAKKRLKKEKKRKKTELKEKKKLIRLQPKGTTITIDDNKGIEIHMPEIMEIKTITTSDPDEDKRRK